MRWPMICAVLFCAVVSVNRTFAQKPVQPPAANAARTFADEKQMSVRYDSAAGGGKEELTMGKVWTPGGSPMNLFTQAELSVGASDIPIGAYSLYIIPEKKSWTLIVNRNVTTGSQYDEKQDLLRVPMQIGQLGRAEKFQVVFAHVAPKQCNMRIYHSKAASWVEFRQK